MKIDINELEIVTASRGGSKHPKCSLSRGGYISFNNAFKKMNEIENKNSLDLKAIKKEDKLIVAVIFFNNKDEGSFKLSLSGISKRSSFSGRNLFSQFNVDYRTLVPKGKSIKLIAFFQNTDGKNYLIIEIPLQKK